ncbi:MAG TPA: cellulase family glycosylhydrolase [Candidatus Paceibacterota bacterium]|nr:cellulase family glycosylhydrolase [Verrucomicrobiota bacterium]HSA09538.1 cellulase family glycosylhydrolase [Candidatus Paceibacterota bacterium]
MNIKHLPITALVVCLIGCGTVPRDEAGTQARQWTPPESQAWYKSQPWLVGCNFIPSTAINQLEMWQADTWDPATIDRELGWAADLGFTSVRVFLHDLLWQQDKKGFLKRMDQFLDLARKHDIGVMFVLFDGVWDPFPRLGRQREPRPHIHNSGWVQSPGAEVLRDPARQDVLKDYVQGVVGRFRNDRRVQVWDVFNEPDNPVPQYRDVELKNKAEVALALLEKACGWAREVRPSQPLTSGVWIGNWADPAKLTPMERFQIEESDVISFHSYGNLEEAKKCVQNLRRYNRPILCTEYMARPNGSRFDPILGYFQQDNVGAYNWGFVNGKSQTIYPWDSWKKEYRAEPPVWFHDIFRANGSPYDPAETEYIKAVTSRARR